MGKFFSIPGTRVSNSTDTPGDVSSRIKKMGSQYRGELPDPKEDPRLSEFFAHRAKTSHQATGLDPDQIVNYYSQTGEVRPTRIEGEEKNSHTGEIDQYVQVSDEHGSGTRKITWEPNGDRGMVVRSDRRVHE